MRNLLLILLLCLAPAARATDIYFAQAAAGSATGSSCANARALSSIAAGDWTAGNTLHLCGTITIATNTTGITALGSGTNGNPITLLFESGAILQSAKFNGCADGPAGSPSGFLEGGAIDIPSTRSWIIVDGGTNGLVQNTATGTGLANDNVCSLGIATLGDNIIIRNLTIQNIYKRTAGTANGNGGSTADLFVSGGTTSVKICNLTLTNASIGAELNFHGSSTTPGITTWTNPASCNSNSLPANTLVFGNNTIHDHNWMVPLNGTGAPVIINNEHYDWSNWTGFSSGFHNDGYFITGASAATFKPYLINNYAHGEQASSPSGALLLFTDDGVTNSGKGQQAVLVGNIVYGTGGGISNGQGFGIQTVTTGNPKGPYQWYHNVFINYGFSIADFQWHITSPTIDIRNNIFDIPVPASNGWFFQNSNTGFSFSTLTVNGNSYFGGRNLSPNGPFGIWTSNVLYPAWKTNCVAGSGTLCDTNSSNADPLLTGESSFSSGGALGPTGFAPLAGSPTDLLGDNLTTQCASIPNQCQGMPQTVGAGGSCGSGCVARPGGSTRWTSGAFQLPPPARR